MATFAVTVTATCGAILAAVIGIAADKCWSDDFACKGLTKAVRVNVQGENQTPKGIPIWFGCFKAPEGSKDAKGNSCEKQISKCCIDLFKRNGDCVFPLGEAAVFVRNDGRFCVTCKASERPLVRHMSDDPTEACRAEDA